MLAAFTLRPPSRLREVNPRKLLRTLARGLVFLFVVSLPLYSQESPSLHTQLRDLLREAQTAIKNGELDSALQKLRDGVRIARRIRSISGEGSAYSSLGTVFHWKGDYPQALEYYGKAL